MQSKVRRDGSTGGGHKPWYATLEDKEPLIERSLNEGPGYRLRMAPKSGWAVVELDIQADPRKDAKWAGEMRALLGEQRFQREYLRNWTLSTQSPYYAAYVANGGDDFFVRDITSLGTGPIYLGLDFGVRHPAVVAAQANARKTRLYFLREWMPAGIQARPFLEVVGWLCGLFSTSQVGPEALTHVVELQRKADEGRGPAVPWFDGSLPFVRHSSQEALRTSQEVASESRERRIVDIWEAAGMPLNVHYAQVKGGGDVIRHLMRKPPKGVMPYLVVDRSCKLIREGFGGGYTFKKPTRENPVPDEPAKDGYYEHTQDCVKYIATNAIDMKAIDDGTPDNREAANRAPAQIAKATVKPRDVYSRGDLSDNSEGVSTSFGVGRNDIYSREEE